MEKNKNKYCNHCKYAQLYRFIVFERPRCNKKLRKEKRTIVLPIQKFIKTTIIYANAKYKFNTNEYNDCEYYKKSYLKKLINLGFVYNRKI